MTAYEVTQALLAHACGAQDAATKRPPTRRLGRLRLALTTGMAAGALILAVPAASAAESVGAPGHSAILESSLSSTLPSTITLTTRRTGSVIL